MVISVELTEGEKSHVAVAGEKRDCGPIVTIIIAVYNGEKTIQRALDSIGAQTYSRKEVVVIDGGSKDGTPEILRENSHAITYWQSEADNGIYDAWNKGLRHATGEWICFLGADDYLWSLDSIERMVSHLDRLGDAIRVVYGQVAVVAKSGQLIEVSGDSWGVAKKKLKQVMVLPHQAVMHRRSLFDVHGHFSDKFRIAGDYELLLRELKDRDAVSVPEVMTAMQYGGISSNPRSSMLLLTEMRLAQKMNGVSRLPGWRWLAAYARVRMRQLLRPLVGEQRMHALLDMGRAIMGKGKFWTRTD